MKLWRPIVKVVVMSACLGAVPVPLPSGFSGAPQAQADVVFTEEEWAAYILGIEENLEVPPPVNMGNFTEEEWAELILGIEENLEVPPPVNMGNFTEEEWAELILGIEGNLTP